MLIFFFGIRWPIVYIYIYIFIDFMFNAKLLDHNAHMQEELEKANL
jgi:hypothetical protein